MGLPLRIALVVERLEPGGGVEGVAWAVAHHLARTGDEVHVFARRAAAGSPWAAGPGAPVPGDPDAGARPGTPSVHLLPVNSLWQPARVLAFSRAAGRATRDSGFDVVQTFSRTRHQDVYRAGGGCHRAYMERAYGPGGARLRRISPRHAVLLGIEERVFADPSQWVLCNSEMVRDEIAGRYGVPEDRLPVIPNGVDLERFRPDPAPPVRATLRADLGATNERVWLLVGSGFRRKGVDTALHALAAATDSRAQLWVVGRDEPGPWRRIAENLGVAGRVRWLGSREDMPDVYAGADALLLPTRYDAFANVCLEAAASGLPVVTSGANGAAGWLGPVALVVEDPEDAAGFAKALDILDDPRQREELGRAARARAEQASWESHVEALHELYSRIRN